MCVFCRVGSVSSVNITEIAGKSLYQSCHPADSDHLRSAHVEGSLVIGLTIVCRPLALLGLISNGEQHIFARNLASEDLSHLANTVDLVYCFFFTFTIL